MSEDITYCLNKDCKKTKCERHASHIKDKYGIDLAKELPPQVEVKP